MGGHIGTAPTHLYQTMHVVCPYPIGVILSIAQGWQVQRSLPWVTETGKGATHNVGCTFFRHKLTMLHPH